MDESFVDLDNLAENFEQLDVNDSKNSKRRPTADEVNDLRNTQLVRNKNNQPTITFEDFNFLMVIGRGSFGKVFLAELKTNKKLYAVKSIRKDILI